ncbi:MAG TPA: transporter [Reyranella sp.]|nr:transporter [Reyranella sp.]
MMSRKVAGWLAALATCVAAPAAEATEGAASYYFPGAFGSFLVAVPPQPGFSVASQTLIFGGNAQKSVLNGRQTFGINAFAVYEYLAGLYAFEQPVLGGRLQIGVAAPVVGYATMRASLQTQRFGTFSGTASDTAFGDLMLTPFSLSWSFGELNAKILQMVIAPTGHYDPNAVINVGRNYWAFDTQVGFTWFHKATGTEISVLPGLMINTMNPATNYRSGTEFHLDFMVNQFVAKDIAIGIQGYWYKQLDGDSGAGATFGPFMGESFGMGPAVLWAPEQLGGRYAFIVKWQHDFSNTNRLNGDWGSVTMSWRF